MESTSHDALREQIERFPTEPGVYLFKDEHGRVLYVGKARSLRARVRNYLRDGADGRYHIQFLLRKAMTTDYLVTGTEQEALILENNLIKKYRPRYNIFLKDDKTYVNLRLNVDHPFPRLTVVRRPRRDSAQYFGPFASAGSVRSTLRTIGRIFPMRTCSDTELANRQRPCLYYYIKRCPAPCVGKIDAQEYAETVRRLSMFLKGRGSELLKSLSDKMDLLSAERRYEEAARIRNQVFAIQSVLEKQRITSMRRAERDAFAACRRDDRLVIQTMSVRAGEVSGGESYTFGNVVLSTAEHLASFINQYYQGGAAIPEEIVLDEDIPGEEALAAFLSERRGKAVRFIHPVRGDKARLLDMAKKNAVLAFEEGGVSERNRELLEDLQEMLALQHYPRRIECYDISNIQGTDAVGSGVAFIDGEPSKGLYRHYRIRTVAGADDYAMMREVLERRISRGLKEGDLPDLLLVDGGRGQLGVALEVANRLGADAVDVVGIAKVRDERGRKVRGKERIYTATLPEPLLLEGNSAALYLLERIRDEAHRFAITHHRRRRGKRIVASRLDGIPGVGPVLKTRLLAEFGSVARIRTTSLEALASVRGMSGRLAQILKDALS
ncbi:MAG: excinuclease ABC subunit UvrC [Candidatus Krumholzibacteriota bacterium]|nr:excinuclease ABC subunit UvrC [Candidatus Krumholzibacteriota bacterium]